MTPEDKKEIQRMILEAVNTALINFEKRHRMSSTSMIVDTPTDVNAVVNVQYLIDNGLITP